MDKNKFLIETLDRIQSWIKAADQKVSIFLAFQGLILGILLPGLPAWLIRYSDFLPCFVQGLIWVGISLILLSLIFSIMVVSPVLKHRLPGHSITFFGDIGNSGLSKYKEAVENLTELQYQNELTAQVHINAKIASKKHTKFKWSILAFYCGSSLILLGFILLLI